MDTTTRTHLDNLRSGKRDLEDQAFSYLIAATDTPVDWAYEAWEQLVQNLRHKAGHQRAIAAQVLCNLAKSDPEKRMLRDFPALLAVTKDEKFVTARHCLLNLWKVGAAGPDQQRLLLAGLEKRFNECITEKNCTLIRYDIIQVLHTLYTQVKDETIRQRALTWIATEQDEKYRKKYATLWKT